MQRQMYLNIPVKDLKKTMEFFSKLGFGFNKKFTNNKAACMIISKDIYVMLLSEKFFKTFIKKEIANAKKTTEALIGISAKSRKEVDEIVDNAISAGGKEPRKSQDHGWMYSRTFEDLDGHIWEILFIDERC